MRFLPFLAVLALLSASRLHAQGNPDPIVFSGTIPTQSATTSVGTPPLDLRPYFSVPSITGQLVQFNTPTIGVFNVEMDSAAAPNTVTNFLAYVNANRYANSFMHRTDRNVGIVQGGTFLASLNGSGVLNSVTTSAPINLETGDTKLNTRGTIAMARMAAPNTATSGWFINVTDNSVGLPPASSGGYAAFGRVVGTGMTVVDALYALPVLGGNITVVNSSTGSAQVTIDTVNFPPPSNFGTGWTLLGSPVQSVIGNFITLAANANQNISSATSVPYTYFSSSSQAPLNELTQLPVFNQLPSWVPSLSLSNLVTQSSITAVPLFPASASGASFATFSAASSDTSLVRAAVSGSGLYVSAAKNLTGSATVTVTATDSNGNSTAGTPFTVNVTRKVPSFNGDAIADLVFQNSYGQIATWYLNAGGAVTGSAFITPSLLGDWRIVTKMDLNGDGNTDLILQNNFGQIVIWYLNSSGVVTGSGFISSAGLGDWRVVASADLDHNGVPDLIFQNNYGQIVGWLLNSSGAVIGSGFMFAGGLGDWRVKCAADINSDGIADIVFQNTFGQIVVWYLDLNINFTGSAFIFSGGLGDWTVAGAVDINGDGYADLLIQNNYGQVVVWYLNSSGAVTGSAFLSAVGLGDWRVR